MHTAARQASSMAFANSRERFDAVKVIAPLQSQAIKEIKSNGRNTNAGIGWEYKGLRNNSA